MKPAYQTIDEEFSMGRGALRYGKCEMAAEKAQGKSDAFSTLGIGSSVMLNYIRD